MRKTTFIRGNYRLYGRQPATDRFRGNGNDSVFGKRRRDTCPDGSKHAASPCLCSRRKSDYRYRNRAQSCCRQRCLFLAKNSGTVVRVGDKGSTFGETRRRNRSISLTEIQEANQGTTINQRPIVREGDRVERRSSVTDRVRTTVKSPWARTLMRS